MKYLSLILLSSFMFAQSSYTEEEVLNIIKDRDAEWSGKVDKLTAWGDALKIEVAEHQSLINMLEDQLKVDTELLNKKDKQIELLKSRDEANEKLVKLVKPSWYEHRYLWLAIGFYTGYKIGDL